MYILKSAILILAILSVAVNAKRVKVASGDIVCACTMNYNPVCASDGFTYSNACEFECARDEAREFGRKEITLTNEGECSL